MELIDLYIYEVTRRLPEKNREDIALELRSTIADMLPNNPTETEVKEVLTQLGNPAVMASGYLDRPMHLIGPKYFDAYTSLLKLILPIALIFTLIFHIGETILTSSGNQSLLGLFIAVISGGVWLLLNTAIQTAFWMTIIFVIIERTDSVGDQLPLTKYLTTWTPEELKSVNPIPIKKRITKWHIFGNLLWTVIWATVYFNAANIIGIYETRGEDITFVTEVFNQYVLQTYWPIVVISILFEIGLAIYKTIQKQWTNKVAILNAVVQMVGLGVVITIFSNPEIWNEPFITAITDAFNTNKSVENWAKQTSLITIVIILIITIYDIYEGFKKARL